MARDGLLPTSLARVHPRWRTPHVALLAQLAIALPLALSGSFVQLALLSIIARLTTYIGTAAAVPILRRRMGDRPGAIRLPGGPTIPILALGLSLALLSSASLQNLLAGAIARAAGADAATIAAAIRTFAPIPHRLELVREVDGVRYVNDSIATTPERTLAGIRSFSEPLVLLLGGRDKDLPKDELAREAMKRCHAIVFFGEHAQRLHDAFAAEADDPENNAVMFQVAALAEAVLVARKHAEPGEVVLLSPACTSFDAYRNFEERGDEFRRLVAAMKEER